MRTITSLFLFGCLMPAADYKAGVSRLAITPDKPIQLIGYANRNHESEGVVHDLWAKALAIEDAAGKRVVIVTMDLACLPKEIGDSVAGRVQKQFGLERSRLVLNVSHTHSGPALDGRHPDPNIIYALTPEQDARIKEYSAKLADKLVSVVGSAIRDLSPANLSVGNGTASFAFYRRVKNPRGGINLGRDPNGPTDRDVPVLKVSGPDGKLRAVLFAYACHNTSAGGGNVINGDYAGFAQIEVEKANPGTTALFMALCGGDQGPDPTGSLAAAAKDGAMLAAEVNRVLRTTLQPVRGSIASAFQIVELKFAPHTREQFEAQLNTNRARHAKAMLKYYDEGHPIRSYPYPVQAIAFGRDLTLLALGGEVVVGYDLTVKKEFGSKGMIVAGYCNDIMAYIPTLQILKEGGHEGGGSMGPYGQPGPWADDIEQRIQSAIHEVLKQVGRTPQPKNGD